MPILRFVASIFDETKHWKLIFFGILLAGLELLLSGWFLLFASKGFIPYIVSCLTSIVVGAGLTIVSAVAICDFLFSALRKPQAERKKARTLTGIVLEDLSIS